jgi:hypothetical protein
MSTNFDQSGMVKNFIFCHLSIIQDITPTMFVDPFAFIQSI